MMIDFIRNNGKLHEQQEKYYKMLQIELEYWGINEDIFKKKDEADIMQEFLDRPPLEIFDKSDQGIFFEETFN